MDMSNVSGRPKIDNTNTPVQSKGNTVQTDQAGPIAQTTIMHSSTSGPSSSQDKPSPKLIQGQKLAAGVKSPPTTECVGTEVNLQDTILAEIRELRQDMNRKFDGQQASLVKFESTLAAVKKEVSDITLRFSTMYEEFEEFQKTIFSF